MGFISTERPGAASEAYPILRINPGAATRFVVQSSSPVFVATHWFDRLLWCTARPDCPACEAQAVRFKAYVLVGLEHLARQRVMLLEAPSSSVDRLYGLSKMAGLDFAPGLVVEATRKSARRPLMLDPIEVGGSVLEGANDVRRVLAALATLQRLPALGQDQSPDEWQNSIVPELERRLRDAMRATSA